MRTFKPKSLVIAALKKSEFLQITDDKLISRRKPWDGRWMVPGDDEDPSPIYREPWLEEDFPSDGEQDLREKRLLEGGLSTYDEDDNSNMVIRQTTSNMSDKGIPPVGYKFDKNHALIRISARHVSIASHLQQH
jgi:hypothetical protein